MTYQVRIGIPYDSPLLGQFTRHHSEVECSSAHDALVLLWALRGKSVPENAMANIGDHRTWVDNRFMLPALLPAKLADEVAAKIREEDDSDWTAEADTIINTPDIIITQDASGCVMVRCDAMQHEAPCNPRRIGGRVSSLITEYRSLLIAGEISGELIEA